jgi:hypothetical protein
MIAQTYVRFEPAIRLDLRIAIEGVDHEPEWLETTELPLHLHLDAVARTITAYLPPIPGGLVIYGPEDFLAACGDTPDEHAERLLQVLGSDPAKTLQALIDGTATPELPPRVPREIPNWRAKVILHHMGLLAKVEAAIAALPEPERTVSSLAWAGDAKLARRGKTVLGLASALGLTPAQLDQLFIAAEVLEI